MLLVERKRPVYAQEKELVLARGQAGRRQGWERLEGFAQGEKQVRAGREP